MTYDLQPEASAGWRDHRVAQGLLLKDGAVLLAANVWYTDSPPIWTLPGGRAEPGEGLEEALHREFSEETGLQIGVERLAYVVEARSTHRSLLFLTSVFIVRRLSGELSCEADPGVVDLRYVPVAELPLLIPAPSLGEPLTEFLRSPELPARYWFFPEY